jgi:hypothetical protein
VRYTNRAALPPHLFNVLKAAHEAAQGAYHAGRAHGSKIISVTELIAPPQKRHLERDHADELEIDVLDTVPSLRGTSLHYILELAGKDAPEHIPEERLQTTLDTWTISGKSDAYTTRDGKLIDFKDSSVWAYLFGKREWDAQLNILRWIRVRNGGFVSSLEIDLFCGDWRRSEARRDEKYPDRVVVMPIALWTLEETERYVRERLALHASEAPPPCSAEERWQKPTKWAAKKKGALRASKLFDEEIQATQYAATIPNGIVEKRAGESTRCLDYCAAAPWCKQWKADPTNPANGALFE